jgi:hypothetical protein
VYRVSGDREAFCRSTPRRNDRRNPSLFGRTPGCRWESGRRSSRPTAGTRAREVSGPASFNYPRQPGASPARILTFQKVPRPGPFRRPRDINCLRKQFRSPARRVVPFECPPPLEPTPPGATTAQASSAGGPPAHAVWAKKFKWADGCSRSRSGLVARAASSGW